MGALVLVLGILAGPEVGDTPPALPEEPGTEASADDAAAAAPAPEAPTPADEAAPAPEAPAPANEAAPAPEASAPADAATPPADATPAPADVAATPADAAPAPVPADAEVPPAAVTPVVEAPAPADAAAAPAGDTAAATDADAGRATDTEAGDGAASNAAPSGGSESIAAPVAAEEIRAAPAQERVPVAAPEAEAEAASTPDDVTAVATVGATVRDVHTENPYWVTGWLEYRTLLVTDPDPLNGMSLWGHVKAGYRLFPGAKAYLRVGFDQQFVAETGQIAGDNPLVERFVGDSVQNSGESGFNLLDFRLGFEYAQNVGLDIVPLESAWLDEHAVTFVHRLELFLPTSRDSRIQELYFAPRYLNLMRLNVWSDLTVGWDMFLQYNFHRFAERAGIEGGLNDQFVTYGGLNLQWVFDDLPFAVPGDIAVSLDAYTVYTKKYDSDQVFVSDLSSTSFWTQDWGWDFYVDYTPVDYFTVELALEQGSPYLRDGKGDVTLFHRDETELVTRLIGRY